MMKCPICGRTVAISHEKAKPVCTACGWGGDAPVLTTTRGVKSWRMNPVVIALNQIALVIVLVGLCAFLVYDIYTHGVTVYDLFYLFAGAIPMGLAWWALKT